MSFTRRQKIILSRFLLKKYLNEKKLFKQKSNRWEVGIEFIKKKSWNSFRFFKSKKKRASTNDVLCSEARKFCNTNTFKLEISI